MSRQCVAKAVGTFTLVFFGVGSVPAAVLTGAQQGLWPVAVVWGIAIAPAPLPADGATEIEPPIPETGESS